MKDGVETDMCAEVANQTGNGQHQELKDRIRTWLIQDGWTFGGPLPNPEAAWVMVAQDTTGLYFTFAQLKNQPDRIDLIAGAALVPNHRDAYATLPPRERIKLLFDVRLSLLGVDVEFSEEGEGEPPDSYRITQKVYSDGLSRDIFFQRVMHVRRAVQTVLAKFAQAFE